MADQQENNMAVGPGTADPRSTAAAGSPAPAAAPAGATAAPAGAVPASAPTSAAVPAQAEGTRAAVRRTAARAAAAPSGIGNGAVSDPAAAVAPAAAAGSASASAATGSVETAESAGVPEAGGNAVTGSGSVAGSGADAGQENRVSGIFGGLSPLFQALMKFVNANRRSSAIIFFTLVPTLCTYLYTALIYDPMYISKTSFTISSNTMDKVMDLKFATMMSGTTVNKDLLIVYAYIKSLDLFNELDGEIGLKKHFQNHDPVSTMPAEPTLADIEDYWDDLTEVKIDSDSEILMMTVRAYDPAYAKLLADTILSKIDKLVNTMNDNALEDSIRLARQEVEKAKARVKAVSDKIRIYRDKHKYIDPSTEAGSTLGLISSLEAEIAKKKAELYEKQGYMHPDSQEIVNLNRRIEALEEQVRELRSKIVSASGTHQGGESQFSVSKSVGEYEDLQLEHTFAQKLLESSLSTLENARIQSASKSKYLVRIDEPKVPDESLWPRPFTSASIVLIISFMLILGISLIVTAVMEHMGI